MHGGEPSTRLRTLISGLRMLRTDESDIERSMSILTQLYSKKNQASESLASFKLRSAHVQAMCEQSTDSLRTLVQGFNGLSNHRCLHLAVAYLVGGDECVPGRAATLEELRSVVYHASPAQKHSDAQPQADALAQLSTNNAAAIARKSGSTPLCGIAAKLLFEHVLQGVAYDAIYRHAGM